MPYLNLDEGLMQRRSIRKYLSEPVPDETAKQVLSSAAIPPLPITAKAITTFIKNKEIVSR
jgi:nitroreductase